MYVIRNGIIVQPDRLLFGYELVVEDDRIAAIQQPMQIRCDRRGARRYRRSWWLCHAWS